MKKSGKVLCILLLLVMIIGCQTYFADVITEQEQVQIKGGFEYPITPGCEEWTALGSVAAKIEACRIPQDVLDKMTNEQLYEAIIEFPFLLDVFVTDRVEDGVASVESNCDAYRELLKRDNAKEFMMQMVDKEIGEAEINTVKDEIINDAIVELIIHQEKFSEVLTYEDYVKLAELSTNIELSETSELTTITTPNGTNVEYLYAPCNHTEERHRENAQYAVDTYNVILIHPGTCSFNCHSYAWFSPTVTNTAWIEDPSPYMIDGSYRRVLSGIRTATYPVLARDIVFYGTNSSPSHSARMVSNGSGEFLENVYVYSKWGELGVYKHKVGNVPAIYDTENISVWTPNWEEED